MWWFNSTPYHLPEPLGPFVPGCADVMLDYSIKGLFLRLYYPTDAEKNDKLNYKKWIPWIPDYSYIVGIARLIMCSTFLIRLAFWWKSGNIHIPVLFCEKVKEKEKLKCVIISHGLGGYRFLYSVICCELASRGYLVLAVEHRDQSASSTYYYQSKEHAKNDIRTVIDYRSIDLGKDHYENRNRQVHQRADECSRALDFLINLNSGNVPHNVLDDVSNKSASDFKLESLIGRLDLCNVTMMGHSFGAASALLTISRRKEITQGVLFDPWMFPVKNEELHNKITQPLLFINTQTFHIRANVKAMEKFLIDDKQQMYTMLHTTHEFQTDTNFVVGSWLNWFMKKLDPLQAIKINNCLMLRFLKQTTGFPENVESCENYINDESSNIAIGLTKPWA